MYHLDHQTTLTYYNIKIDFVCFRNVIWKRPNGTRRMRLKSIKRLTIRTPQSHTNCSRVSCTSGASGPCLNLASRASQGSSSVLPVSKSTYRWSGAGIFRWMRATKTSFSACSSVPCSGFCRLWLSSLTSQYPIIDGSNAPKEFDWHQTKSQFYK